MNKIHKYELELFTTELQMPKGAEILDIAFQGGNPVLWAIVDSDSYETEERTIVAFQTGDEVIGLRRFVYLKTVCSEKGVYHFFEKI
jgi:hypothetical protein